MLFSLGFLGFGFGFSVWVWTDGFEVSDLSFVDVCVFALVVAISCFVFGLPVIWFDCFSFVLWLLVVACVAIFFRFSMFRVWWFEVWVFGFDLWFVVACCLGLIATMHFVFFNISGGFELVLCFVWYSWLLVLFIFWISEVQLFSLCGLDLGFGVLTWFLGIEFVVDDVSVM